MTALSQSHFMSGSGHQDPSSKIEKWNWRESFCNFILWLSWDLLCRLSAVIDIMTVLMRGFGHQDPKFENWEMKLKGKFLQFYFMTILRPVVQTQHSHRYYDCSETCCMDSVQSLFIIYTYIYIYPFLSLFLQFLLNHLNSCALLLQFLEIETAPPPLSSHVVGEGAGLM
jgi:hypothetical protein